MGKLYTQDDLHRWKESYRDSISIHIEKLETNLPQRQIDFHLSTLALSQHTWGLIGVAESDFPGAIDRFRASVETRCRMYERFEQGVGRAMDAGHFQSLLVSLVTNCTFR